MGRPRREIGKHGELFCRGCNTVKHISDFYCSGPPWACVLDDEDIDTWYGRPQSRCKECVAKYQKTRTKRVLGGIAINDEVLMMQEDEEFRYLFEECKKQGLRLTRLKDGSLHAYPSTQWD